MAQLLPNVYQRFFDSNGNPLAGGQLFSYQAGTTIPQATYTDQGAGTPNPNPVVLDGAGGGQIWIKNTGYKFQLQDANGVVQWTVDQVYLIEPGAVGSGQIANGAVGTTQLANGAVTTAKIQTGAITTALLAAGAITSGVIANGAVTIAKLDPNIDLTQLGNMVEVVFKRTDDALSGGRIQAVPQYPWSAPIQQSNPGVLPAGQGNASRFSPDGRFLAIAHNTSPFVTIYERQGSTFTKLADPASLPAGAANHVAWSPNGDFLCVAHATTPFITIYQRQGNNFTKLANPAALPPAAGNHVAFSPNGEFLAVCANASPGFKIYQIKGTTFTDITGSSGITSPDGSFGVCAWSADSQYLALSQSSGVGNVFNCYQRTGVTFTGMTITGGQPASFPTALAFTPDNGYLVGGHSTAPNYAFYYTVSGSTITGVSNPFPGGSPPAGAVLGLAISPNGALIAVVSASTPFLQIYSGSFAGGWVLNSAPASLPAGALNRVDWSPTNQWLAAAVNISPFVQIYQTAGQLPVKAPFYCRNFADA